MWTGTVTQSEIHAADRWNVSYFSVDRLPATTSAFDVVELGSFAKERKGSIDPQSGDDLPVNYLGLENIRPLTGELVDFRERMLSSIKSRCKLFSRGDILYGRLRPELNKAYLADGHVSEGICSGEFIVLSIDRKFANPRFIRHLLASPYVTEVVQRYRAGAALPRIAAKDLLSIKLPLPPLEFQNDVALHLEQADKRIVALRNSLENHPKVVQDALMNVIEQGELGSSFANTDF